MNNKAIPTEMEIDDFWCLYYGSTRWKNQILFDFSYKSNFIFSEMSIKNYPHNLTADIPLEIKILFDFEEHQSEFVEPVSVLPAVNTKFYEEDEDVNLNYLSVRKSTFTSFFVENLIDIPICFKKSKSIKNKNIEFFFLKFSNLFMREGKKEKAFRVLLSSFFIFFDEINHNLQPETKLFDWYKFIFSITMSSFYNLKQITSYSHEEIPFIFNHLYNPEEKKKEIDTEAAVKNLIKTNLCQLSPMFLYFIYNVDKNVRKFTRGKSGKYVFVWKYIAPYKRNYLMFKWFLKEIKFDDSRKLNTRLSNLFNTLFFDISNTHAVRAKNFTYAFIFKNFRKTFMISLKTTLKK